MRSLPIEHLDRHAHSLGDNEDIGEDYSGVDEAIVAGYGLQGQRAGNGGCAAAGEEVGGAFCFMVFGKVASGWEERS